MIAPPKKSSLFEHIDGLQNHLVVEPVGDVVLFRINPTESACPPTVGLTSVRQIKKLRKALKKAEKLL